MKKILIKHDDEGMRRAIGSALAVWGYLNLETPDILCLCEKAIAESPSLIVLDLMTPMTGTLAALSTLAECPNTASIPVIVLSNSDDPQRERLCRQEGAFDYLGRGWTLQELRIKIETALANHSS